MTNPHPTCPICGRPISTSIDQTDYLIHAFCRNDECAANRLIGKGDSTRQVTSKQQLERKAMTTEEMRELDEWCGKTFDLPFAVDCWILSNDGGKTRCSGHFNTEQVAMDHHALNEYFKDSKAYHWQIYPQATRDPAAAMMVHKRCLEKCEEDDRAIKSWKDGHYFCMQLDEPTDAELVNEETLELTICLFAKALFS